MKKNNYVPCNMCSRSRREDPSYDPHITPCQRCHNIGTVLDPKEILCNNCGETMCPIGTYNEQIPHGLYNISIAGGYDSYHLFDMTSYKFSICEKCLRELFMKFKIPPLVCNDVNYLEEEDAFILDQKSYDYRVWKDSGKHHEAYVNGKCNVEKDCSNDALYTHLVSNSFTEDCCCEDHKEIGIYSNTTLTKFISNNLKVFL